VADALDVQLTGDAAARARRVLDAVRKVHGADGLPRIPLSADAGSEGAFQWDARTGDAVRVLLRPDRPTDPSSPELSLAHEIGHFLDMSGLPGAQFESTRPTLYRMRLLMREIRRTPTYRIIAAAARAGGTGSALWAYLRHRNELFARAYAQWLAWRSGDLVMREQLDEILGHPDPGVHHEHWPHEEFLPMAMAFNRLFEGLGWLTRT